MAITRSGTGSAKEISNGVRKLVKSNTIEPVVLPLKSNTIAPKTPTKQTTRSINTPGILITKSPSKSPKKPKTLLEDSLDHIELNDNELPASFVDYHQGTFIEGVKHILRIDPSLYRPIVYKPFELFKKTESESIKEKPIEDEGAVIKSYWLALLSSVMSQQISGSAAKAIYTRFEAMFDKEPNPKELLAKLTEELRGIGLSFQKIKYVSHISEVFSDPESNLTKIEFYKNNDLSVIIDELVLLKGIGVWSAKMFALFTLREYDVFAHDDLGIARGVSYYLSKRPQVLKSIKEEVAKDDILKALLKKKSKFEKADSKRDWIPYHDQYVIYLSNSFKPYRSILMMIFYRLSATNVDILEQN